MDQVNNFADLPSIDVEQANAFPTHFNGYDDYALISPMSPFYIAPSNAHHIDEFQVIRSDLTPKPLYSDNLHPYTSGDKSFSFHSSSPNRDEMESETSFSQIYSTGLSYESDSNNFLTDCCINPVVVQHEIAFSSPNLINHMGDHIVRDMQQSDSSITSFNKRSRSISLEEEEEEEEEKEKDDDDDDDGDYYGDSGWKKVNQQKRYDESIEYDEAFTPEEKEISSDVDSDSDPSYKPIPTSRKSNKRQAYINTKTTSRHSHKEPTKSPVSRPGQGYPCLLSTYGCTKSFRSKNEWKRHMFTQDIRFEFFRCKLCKPSAAHDFKRRDLLVAHLKRKHRLDVVSRQASLCMAGSGGEAGAALDLPDTVEDIMRLDERDPALTRACEPLVNEFRVRVRDAPEKLGCILCGKQSKTWEARTEHAAEHFERLRQEGRKIPHCEQWRADGLLQNWLLREGMIVQTENGLRLKDLAGKRQKNRSAN